MQARLRGMTLMALSNKFGHLVLSTGNKSELAVGYCTIYGDMAGGLGVINGVPQKIIFLLARFLYSQGARGGQHEIISGTTPEKTPGAGIRSNQKGHAQPSPY